jgi:hypothetical protein
MALCSESIGSSSAPLAAIASMNSWPDTTRVSLLASRIRLPAWAAASVAGRPAAPTIAAISVSTSGAVATWVSAAAPSSTSTPRPSAAIRSRSAAAAAGSLITAKRGRWARHCSTMRSTWVAPVSAKISKRSGWRATTSSVLTPMVPVAPRMVSTRGFMRPAFMQRAPATSACRWRSAGWRSARRCDQARRHGPAGCRRCPSCRRRA